MSPIPTLVQKFHNKTLNTSNYSNIMIRILLEIAITWQSDTLTAPV